MRCTFDPRDPEANSKAFANGYAVIHGGAYSKEQWVNIRRADAAPPASRFFPSPEVYSQDPDAPMAEIIPPEEPAGSAQPDEGESAAPTFSESLSAAARKSGFGQLKPGETPSARALLRWRSGRRLRRGSGYRSRHPR